MSKCHLLCNKTTQKLVNSNQSNYTTENYLHIASIIIILNNGCVVIILNNGYLVSGNLTATISDHLPQFAIIPNMFSNIIVNKSKIYERDWSKFHQESFSLDYFSVEWEDLLKADELNADNSPKMYLDKINMLLDSCVPLKRINPLSDTFSFILTAPSEL